MVGDSNNLFKSMDRSSRQKINKETLVLNDTLDQVNLIDIHRTFHPKAEYTFFSNSNWTFSRIDHMLGHKTRLNKFKKIEMISNIFSNHNTIRLEKTARDKTAKSTNMWGLHGMLLNIERKKSKRKSKTN